MPEMKVCFRCERSLPADTMHYHHDSGKKDGLTSACRECMGVHFIDPSTIAKDGYRFCSKCGEESPLTTEYFMLHKTGKGGFRGQCRKCRMEKQNQHTTDNWEAVSKQRKNYRYENRVPIAARKKTYQIENREKISERKKVNYLKNWDHIHDYGVRYYIENKVIVDKNNNIYRLKNRDKCNIYGQNYRAKKRELPHTLTVMQWKEIKQHFSNECAYCGKRGPLTQDHFIALNNNGEYTHNNIIPACDHCNSSKQDNSFFWWYPRQPYYSKTREKKILTHLNYNKLRQQQLSLI